MTTIDFSPLFRSMIGFKRLEATLGSANATPSLAIRVERLESSRTLGSGIEAFEA